MERAKIYPNYINYYYYNEGDTVILLKRFSGADITYTYHIYFDTAEEALDYFETNCGA